MFAALRYNNRSGPHMHNKGSSPKTETQQQASSANTPRAVQIGRASLQLLEVVPGVTVMEVLMAGHEGIDVNQIGRSHPLSGLGE